MVAREWEVDGNLAHQVERRLIVRPARRLRRRLKPAVRLVGLIAVLWLMAVGAAAAGSAMAGAGYHVDVLQHQLATAQRQQQQLQATVAALTSTAALNHDAAVLHVRVRPLTAASSVVPVPRRITPLSPWARLGAYATQLWRQVKHLEATGIK